MRNECQKDATLIRHCEGGTTRQREACVATPTRSKNIEERRNKKMQRKAGVERVRETSSSPEREPSIRAATAPFIMLLDPQKVSKMSNSGATVTQSNHIHLQTASNRNDQKPDYQHLMLGNMARKIIDAHKSNFRATQTFLFFWKIHLHRTYGAKKSRNKF